MKACGMAISSASDSGAKDPARWPRRRRLWRLVRFGLVFMVLVGIYAALGGCVSSVTAPPAPDEPVQVYVRFEALHKGLILPSESGGHVEYGFGENGWYALMQDRWYHVFGTVLIPTRATLGRRLLTAPDHQALMAAYPQSKLHALTVSAARARALADELAVEYQKHAGSEIYNRTYRLHFVESNDSSWILYNCNDSIARWLRRLDCSVSFVPIRLGLRIVPED